jgi:hypothetical protein
MVCVWANHAEEAVVACEQELVPTAERVPWGHGATAGVSRVLRPI